MNATQKPSENIEQLSELKKFIENVEREALPLIRQYIKQAERRHEDILIANSFNLLNNEFESLWKAAGTPDKVLDVIDSHHQKLLEAEEGFKVKLDKEQETFKGKLVEYNERAKVFKDFGPCDDKEMEKVCFSLLSHLFLRGVCFTQRASMVDSLLDSLERAQAQTTTFNTKETLFELPLTEYEDLDSIIKNFKPFASLWRTVSLFMANYDVWMNGPFIVCFLLSLSLCFFGHGFVTHIGIGRRENWERYERMVG